MERDAPQWLDLGEGAERRKLAYLAQSGDGAPVLWLGGFRSDMRATKAEALAQWARLTGRAFLRFDYAGHGETGGDFARWTLSHWLEDALAMIAARCSRPPILVGSSMGGWIALLAARKLLGTALAPAGLVLIAPAVDFSEDLMWAQMPEAIRQTILRDGVWLRPSEYSPDPTPITRALIEDGRRHLMFGSEIRTGCPVHILQGMADPDVPWRQAVKLVEHLAGDPVLLTLIKDGDHRLSTPGDIARLTSAVAGITAPA
ncbi:alpha/beta hydrolase [Bosea psychrotolerans]|uniref:Palmitoyl-protein thioesterase ABHD10, mitochondrial n=1 Tax=Bosea psychrotolerans TaxID=1871628 RepID=A0A2S4M042_9HYPH|nr:alpha/beta hydrolase [Bosea psychrotolerans]POR48080.1 pimeloyl-ACP methyl ester carboxylesterase [Bosea psychrotolerans]